MSIACADGRSSRAPRTRATGILRNDSGSEARSLARSGFSLIELLVVVAIVAVVALAVTLSIGGSADRQLRREAERFDALVGQACAEAELGGREIGIVVGSDGYAFRRLSGSDWQDIATDGVLRPRRWIEGLDPELAREGRRVELFAPGDGAPQLVCFSSGELTPFVLTLALGDAPRYRIRGSEDATLKIESVANPR
ncbi:MAG TPA: GspH/FimT family pseudopilin [Rhodanobacteraceae bacterium]|nr:GspH/FimT family pseudopilin [Rhodanobacteraceae bacterium]